MNTLTPATIRWQKDELGNDVPICQHFDDVYFSCTSGREESLYVFCQGNHLSERFEQIAKDNKPTCFVIGETGFGTGLNFLVVATLWCQIMQQHDATLPRLHFISTEKHPMNLDDLKHALAAWQTHNDKVFDELLIQLTTHYPPPICGNHRRHFCYQSFNITLDLWLGDALHSFNTMSAKIDAWFLDGFSPSKNQSLWSDELFHAIKTLSKADATLATFSSSGQVRRAIQAIGMTVKKIKGFGRKREMITASYQTSSSGESYPSQVVVIGAGVSGLLTAYALARQGIAVTLIDKTAPLAGASGNPRALISPKLVRFESACEHFATHAFLYATAVYRTLNQHANVFEQIGVLDHLLPSNKTDLQKINLISPYPKSLVHPQQTAPFLAYLPSSGLINPTQLAKAVLSHPAIDFIQAHIHTLEQHTLEQHTHVIAHSTHTTFKAEHAVICLGFESHQLHKSLCQVRAIRGQVSWIDDSKLANQLPHRAYKYDGYACAFEGTLLFGASFVRNNTDDQVLVNDHLFNIDKLTHALPQFDGQLNTAQLQGRASIRGQTPDYHPMVGQIDKNIFVCSAMGSKGFALAPLCGEIVASLVTNTPSPLPLSMLDKLDPNRPRLKIPLKD